MADGARPSTAAMNGRLWGARSRDWAEIQEATAVPLFEAVMARVGVRAGSRCLDLACGAGRASAVAAARGGAVSGIDAAEPMLEIAKERTPVGDFRLADLQALPFDDESFDVVTSFNGVQFAADPVAALKEARRVTRPDGVVAIAVWDHPSRVEMASVILSLGTLLPPPPPGTPGPFALSEPGALERLARQAGLSARETFAVPSTGTYPDLATALRGFNSTGVAVRAAEAAGEDAVSHVHTAALRPFLQEDGSLQIGMGFLCLLAEP